MIMWPVWYKRMGNPKLSNDQLLLAIDIAYNINRDGKRRKLTKEEYIAQNNLVSWNSK